MLRTFALAGAAYVVMSLSPAPSHAAAWCAYQGGPNQYENCGYHTFAQCRAAVRGVGGDCRPNPYAEREGPGVVYEDDTTGVADPRFEQDWEDDDE